MHRRADRSLEQVWDNLYIDRSKNLFNRFPGWYRGEVVETNDPLSYRRVRVKIPELYNNGVKPEDVMWCVPAPWLGGRSAGSFVQVSIGDIVYVSFEKQHAYGPIFTAGADATRRRSYSMWSVYTPPAPPISEDGKPEEQPKDHLKEYLPKDNRPMSTGFQDRYGSFFIMQSTGFFPKTHDVAPAPNGTDALAKSAFETSKNPPKANDPDVKYMAMGTKYGHMAFYGDQGYDWQKEFDGDFDSDSAFEEERVKYYIRYFNEDEPKDHDQRRIDIRTRLGHKIEGRDVGWEKSRSGEFGDPKTIADSKDRDERWLKMVSKGGHVIQAIDIGFDPESDERYKRLNKSDKGDEPHGEKELGTSKGDDSRMIRLVSRHGNQLILDDRGSSPTSAGTSKTPHGNGFLLRSRKGFQIQGVDKPELDHLMMTTPKDQVFEMNDKFEHVILTTTQSDEVHTEIDGDATRVRPRYVLKTGVSNDPESNTFHLKLDKQNEYIRLKTPSGAGIEMRDNRAPCGQWVETRDQENRAVWMSKSDNFMLIRSKKGQKFILFDDNDDVILIRNEIGKIQIRARDKIEIKCDNGNICLEAPNGQIGMTAKSVEVATEGASHKFDSGGFGTSKKLRGETMAGTHDAIQIPEHPVGPAPAAAKSGNPCTVDDKELARRKPNDFDGERGCDPQKPQKGPVPETVVNSPPGGGGGGGNSPPGTPGGNPPLPLDDPRVNPPPTSPNVPDQTVQDPPEPENPPDPIPNTGGVLWYGVSAKFRDEIENNGLLLSSFSNLLNVPPDNESDRIPLSRTLNYARGLSQAILSQQRYGNTTLILRIRNVDDQDLIEIPSDNEDIVYYKGDLSFTENMEIFEIGETILNTPPQFPNVG